MSYHHSRAGRRATTLLAMAAMLLISVRARAQQTTQLSISAGTATDQRGVRSSAIAVSPGVAWAPVADLSLALGANATRFQSDALSVGVNAAMSALEHIAGPVAFTLDAAAAYSRLQSGAVASFAFGEAMPGAQLRVGTVAIFGGWRASAGRSEESAQRSGIPIGPTGAPAVRVRSAAGPSVGATWTPALEATALRFTVRHDRYAVDGVRATDMLGAMSASWDRIGVDANIGRRAAADERLIFGGANLGVAIRAGLSLDLGAGRYSSNRLTGTPGGTFMSVGITLRGGARAVVPDVHVPGAPPVPRGYTRFAIDARDATTVDVAGDFTDWKPVAAARARSGTWYADVRVQPGQYRYAFRIDGSEWRVPRGATAVDDGFGGKSAWITIGDAQASQESSRRR